MKWDGRVGAQFLRRLSLRAAIHEVGRKKAQVAQTGETMDGGDQGKFNRSPGANHEWTPRHTNSPSFRSVTSVCSCLPGLEQEVEKDASFPKSPQFPKSPTSSRSCLPSVGKKTPAPLRGRVGEIIAVG